MTSCNSKTVDIPDAEITETSDLTPDKFNKYTSSFESEDETTLTNNENWVKLKRAMAILTSIAHFFIATITVYVVLICYLSVNENTALFVWHPALLSTGWFFLMTESILVFSEDNFITNRIRSRQRHIQLHWIIQIFAMLLSYAGFTVIVWHKISKNYSHFYTYHGLFGLFAISLSVVTILFGAYAKLTQSIQCRFYHTVLGSITFILGAITMMLAFNSSWYKSNDYGKRSVQYLCIVLILFVIVVVITKPLITAGRRFKIVLMR